MRIHLQVQTEIHRNHNELVAASGTARLEAGRELHGQTQRDARNPHDLPIFTCPYHSPCQQSELPWGARLHREDTNVECKAHLFRCFPL